MSLPVSEDDRRKNSNLRHHHCKSPATLITSNAVRNDNQEDQTKIKEDKDSVYNALMINLPYSVGEFPASKDSGEDEPKTPTSTDHRIPAMKSCPPAPRKPKCVPATGKRKVPFCPAVQAPAGFLVYFDAMLEEAVYVDPDIVAGVFGAGDDDHAKRLKTLPAPAHDLD